MTDQKMPKNAEPVHRAPVVLPEPVEPNGEQHADVLALQRCQDAGGSETRCAHQGGDIGAGAGMVSLQPLGAEVLLEGAWRFLRTRSRASIRLSAAIWGTAFLVTALLSGAVIAIIVTTDLWAYVFWRAELQDSMVGAKAAMVAMLAVIAVVPLLASALQASMVAPAVGQAVLGRRKSWRWMWRQAKPALLSVVLAQAISHLLAGVVVVAVAVFIAQLTMRSEDLAVAVVLASIPIGFFAAGVYGGYLAMLTSNIVYERKGVFSGIFRALRVLRRSFWRVTLVAALVAALVSVVFSLFLAPFQVVNSVLAKKGGQMISRSASLEDISAGIAMFNQAIVWLGAGLAVIALGGFVASIFTTPFLVAASTLQYLDYRMRFENIHNLFGSTTLELAEQYAGGSGQRDVFQGQAQAPT